MLLLLNSVDRCDVASLSLVLFCPNYAKYSVSPIIRLDEMGKRDKMRAEGSPTSDPSILNLPLYIVPLSLFPPLGMLGDIKKNLTRLTL